MSIPYIVGMGAAYTAALWLLVRRLRHDLSLSPSA